MLVSIEIDRSLDNCQPQIEVNYSEFISLDKKSFDDRGTIYTVEIPDKKISGMRIRLVLKHSTETTSFDFDIVAIEVNGYQFYPSNELAILIRDGKIAVKGIWYNGTGTINQLSDM